MNAGTSADGKIAVVNNVVNHERCCQSPIGEKKTEEEI